MLSLTWQRIERNHTCMFCVLKRILPLEHVFNGYFWNLNFVRRPRTKFKALHFGYLCCFWINFPQINAESNQNSIQRSNSDSCFGLKSQSNFYSKAPSLPLLIIPFNIISAKYFELNFETGFERLPILKLSFCFNMNTNCLLTYKFAS